ncbi:MAG: MerR family transcriptional regulator [Chloroflexi bacterium]|nr:MerR family transcriptional regulator [Chloroflexota bacterium]
MRIRSASQALVVPVPTLRRWTQEFAAGLSPEARASEGRPREFSPRDMRVLRRAKEILSGEDVTYERARRDLSAEGLLSYVVDGDGGGVQEVRDQAAEQAAWIEFIRGIVQEEIATLRDLSANLVRRIDGLERSLDRPNASPTPSGGPISTTSAAAVDSEAERRRNWPRFR